MTVDLFERKTAAQKIVTESQSSHNSIEIKDADQFQCASSAGALEKPPFLDIDLYFTAKILRIKKSRCAGPFKLRLKITGIALETRGIAIGPQYIAKIRHM